MFKADDYRLRLKSLADTLAEAKYALDIDNLGGRLEELKAEQEKPEVWGDLEKSKKIGRDISSIEGKMNAYNKGENAIEEAKAFIDTIGEGAGVYSRLLELGCKNAYSCKFSHGVKGLHDITGCYNFANMRAYLFWCIRDWLNPKNGFNPALPPDDELMEELTEPHWQFMSDGRIIIEKKDEIKKRLKRSPDKMDALANTFYPYDYDYGNDERLLEDFL